MTSRWIAVTVLALLASRETNAACVLNGALPTDPLPTMVSGQEFSFVASRDCATLRFMIRGTTVSKMPMLVGPVGMGLRAYRVVLTESEWDAVAADSGSTLTWVVTGRTSAGVTTRLVTTNDLNLDEPIAFDVSMADARLVGEGELDIAGGNVSSAGDVNADGHDDVLVSAQSNDEGGTDAGAAYLVLGPVSGTLDLSSADAKLVGEESEDYAGRPLSGAGDVNGDGNDDILVASHYNDADRGAAYLVLGPVSGTLDLSLADAKLVGEAAGDSAGYSVSGAGDVDGDGRADMLVGALDDDDDGAYSTGAAYLVLGPATGTFDLSRADAELVGEEDGDSAGYSVSGAGDVDGNGHDDLLVGALLARSVYLVLGPVTGTLDLSMADAKLMGDGRGVGGSVSSAGDVNDDGHDDVLIGASFDGEARNAGAAYLMLGPVTGTLDLSLADAKLVGEERNDQAGISLSGAGDVDGDDHDDLLIGSAGGAYLVLGPVTGTRDLSLADVKFVEAIDTNAGASVAGAGDVDGDGRGDLLLGAPFDSERATWAGAAYLIDSSSL